MTFPDHFSVIDGAVSPQPWMQLRVVKTAEANAVTKTYDPSDGIARNEVLQSVSIDWTNNSPVTQLVYGKIQRGGCRVTLQPRSRAYQMMRNGVTIGAGTVSMIEVDRFGGGADVGKGGLLAIGANYATHEVRINSSVTTFMAQYAGQYIVPPGQTIHFKADVTFKSEFWENTNIDGSDSGTESSTHAGDLRLDMFAMPKIAEPPPRLQPAIVGGAGGVTHDVRFNTDTICATPAGLLPGDVLVAITCTQFGFIDTMDPRQSGWTMAHQRGEGIFGGGDVHMRVWTRNVSGGEPSTFSFGGSLFSEGITVMFGVRGAPGNSINHATSYFVGNHTKRVFAESVDIVSGIGWDKVDPANPAYRFLNVYQVVSNLGVFDFNGPEHQMRAVSLHPGVTADEVADNTSFEVHGLDAVGETRLPTADELQLLREVIDPKSFRDKEVKA
mgnify:CR=1 FL=1